MIDHDRTREGFIAWMKSPAFDRRFNTISRRRKWPYIAGAISLAGAVLCVPLRADINVFFTLVLIGMLLFHHGMKHERRRKEARRHAHVAYANLEPILCAVVIGNRQLFQSKGAVAPALLLGSFTPLDEADTDRLLATAEIFAGLYGEDPTVVPAELQVACRLVNDDTYQPDRRRQVPPDFINQADLWLFDAMLLADDLPSGKLETR